MGTPKGLLRDPDGTPWVARVTGTLADGGCTDVLVVVGAQAARVGALVPPFARTVEAPDWAEGMGASLRTGLQALEGDAADAVLVALVDTPGVGVAVVERLVRAASPTVLARAGFGGVPGHPVLLGREHWTGVAASARGDQGARAYLRDRPVVLVECGDVGSGEDVDRPEDLDRPGARPTT